MHDWTGDRPRVAVVAADELARASLLEAMASLPSVEVVAWAEVTTQLLTLGTRADIWLCAAPPGRTELGRLRERDCVIVTAPPGTDPVAAVQAAMTREGRAPGLVAARPQFPPRQREVLVAYVTGSSLLPTVARELGMGAETLKTHLRRIRAKYAEVGRPAPTRHALYVRAVEDGLVFPPTGRH